MSSRNRGASAVAYDKRENYPTPPHVAECMATLAEALSPRLVMEPSAGMGVVARAALRLVDPGSLIVVDPYDWPELQSLRAAGARWEQADFLSVRRSGTAAPDLIIGNPPFSRALDHTRHALYLLDDDGLLVFLLPAAYLHDGVRQDLRERHPPLLEIGLQERPSFSQAAGRGGGTDSVRYSVFVWSRAASSARAWVKLVAQTGTPKKPLLDPVWAEAGRALARVRTHGRGALATLTGG